MAKLELIIFNTTAFWSHSMGAYEDFKNLEGSRIQPLITAIGTLPAGALVFSHNRAAEGAALFLASIICIAACYFHWLCTDSVFAVAHDASAENNKKLESRSTKIGYYMSWCTFIYGVSSITFSSAGFAAIYSNLTTKISIDTGFVLCLALLVVVVIHLSHTKHLRNTIQNI